MSPTEQYSQRLSEREAELTHFDRLQASIGNVRLVLAALFLMTVWLCFGAVGAALPWLLIPGAAFIAAVLYHHRVRELGSRARRAAAFYRAGLGRIRGQWSGNGPTGERFDVHHHIYGSDLDLFGADSLFELLCAARTPMGEDTLARWLLMPAGIDAIRERQAGIGDLRDCLPRLFAKHMIYILYVYRGDADARIEMGKQSCRSVAGYDREDSQTQVGR